MTLFGVQSESVEALALLFWCFWKEFFCVRVVWDFQCLKQSRTLKLLVFSLLSLRRNSSATKSYGPVGLVEGSSHRHLVLFNSVLALFQTGRKAFSLCSAGD